MAVENDKIKDLFSSKLGSFEPEVPASVWGGLDQLLSQQAAPAPDAASSQASDPSSTLSSTTNAASSVGKASIIKSIVVAVGLTAAVVAGIVFIPAGKDDIDMTPPQAVIEEVTPPIEELVDTVIEMPSAPLLANRVKTLVGAIKEPEDKPVSNVTPATEPLVQKIAKEEKKEDKKEVIEELPTAPEAPLLVDITKASKVLSVGIAANMGALSDNIDEKGSGMLFSRNLRGAALRSALDKEGEIFELKHSQPISVGITISKQLTPKLSLESGIVYTRLSSKITSNSAYNINESQKIDYLGIPLSLSYTLYQKGKTRFYISAGGMIQKDVYGRMVSNMNFSILNFEDRVGVADIFHSEPYYIKKTIKQSNPQLSVRSTLGVSYPLYKKMYIYGTVGGAYYFDAKNAYRTIYSDKKTQLDVNLGIKFDF